MSTDVFSLPRRLALGAHVLAGVLTIVGAPRPRKNEPSSAVSEVIGRNNESVLLTRTAPPGPRWIEVSRWEDLVKASRFMGRPILRLDDGTRSTDQPLFYVPDGPQSYVFDFQREAVNASTSGGYALPPPPEAPQPTPTESLTPATPELPEWAEPPPPAERFVPTPTRPPSATAVPVLDGRSIPTDEVVEQYLGPIDDDLEGPTGPQDAVRVEREIREMIHHVLVVLRGLPSSSELVAPGTRHIERALELLRLGRYGSAQIEVNRAARLVVEDHRT
ncbi:MAG: hypothetical protein WA688_02085 [Thermoplasmata archaeon]